jgi:hypothetical protein
MRCMFLFLALSVLAVPPASAQDIGAQLRVTATGEATAPPDIAHLRAGAVAAEPTAAAALDATSVAMADILAMLDAAGIAEPESAWSRSAIRGRRHPRSRSTRAPRWARHPAASCCSGVSCRWVVEAEWMIRLRVSPRLATWLKISRLSTSFTQAS